MANQNEISSVKIELNGIQEVGDKLNMANQNEIYDNLYTRFVGGANSVGVVEKYNPKQTKLEDWKAVEARCEGQQCCDESNCVICSVTPLRDIWYEKKEKCERCWKRCIKHQIRFDELEEEGRQKVWKQKFSAMLTGYMNRNTKEEMRKRGNEMLVIALGRADKKAEIKIGTYDKYEISLKYANDNRVEYEYMEYSHSYKTSYSTYNRVGWTINWKFDKNTQQWVIYESLGTYPTTNPYQDGKEALLERERKEKEIADKRKEVVKCECGCDISKANKSTHLKSVKHKTIMEKIQKDAEVPVDDRCVVCLDSRKVYASTNCGHRCVCFNCCSTLSSNGNTVCPMCRIPVVNWLEIFL